MSTQHHCWAHGVREGRPPGVPKKKKVLKCGVALLGGWYLSCTPRSLLNWTLKHPSMGDRQDRAHQMTKRRPSKRQGRAQGHGGHACQLVSPVPGSVDSNPQLWVQGDPSRERDGAFLRPSPACLTLDLGWGGGCWNEPPIRWQTEGGSGF